MRPIFSHPYAETKPLVLYLYNPNLDLFLSTMEQFLFFSVEGIRCGIPLMDAVSMIRMIKITPKSECGAGEVGEIKLHGEYYRVISLRKLFGFPEREPLLSDNLVIVDTGIFSLALWVDETYIIQEGDFSDEEQTPSGHLQTLLPGVKIIRPDLIIIEDLIQFIDFSKNDQVKLVDVLYPVRRPEVFESSQQEVREYDYTEKVLTKRAEELALPEVVENWAPFIEVIRFNLIYQEYALEMKYIREVIQTSEITPVPGTPEFIAGICSVRGEIISLVDLRALFSIPEKGLTDLNRVIVLTDNNLTFGILADQITGIGTVNTDELSPPDEDAHQELFKYLQGFKESLFVLNAAALLSDPRMVIDDTEK